MVVARIFDYEINELEYQKELQSLMQKNKLHNPTPELKIRAVDHLIDGYLLLQQAQNLHLKIEDDVVEEKLLDLMLKYKTREEFNDMLAKANITTDALRKQFKNELMVRSYIETFCTTNFEIPEEKLKQIYNENLSHFKTDEMVRVSHILVQDTSNEGAKKAHELRKKINSVEDFERLAKACSDCPSCCKSGDLGFIQKGKMVAEFEDIAFDLKQKEISHPIKTPFGYHIILKTEHKRQKITAFNDIKDALAKRLHQIEQELSLLQHLKKLRENADIEIFEDRL